MKCKYWRNTCCPGWDPEAIFSYGFIPADSMPKDLWTCTQYYVIFSINRFENRASIHQETCPATRAIQHSTATPPHTASFFKSSPTKTGHYSKEDTNLSWNLPRLSKLTSRYQSINQSNGKTKKVTLSINQSIDQLEGKTKKVTFVNQSIDRSNGKTETTTFVNQSINQSINWTVKPRRLLLSINQSVEEFSSVDAKFFRHLDVFWF